MRLMTSLTAFFLLAVGFAASPAFAQPATILSQQVGCTASNRAAANPVVQCMFNILIIDPALDRRLSCRAAIALRYQRTGSTTSPLVRFVNPTHVGGITVNQCFIQPGLGIPHPSIVDISTRATGPVIHDGTASNNGVNAYILYTPTKITLCINGGSLLGFASETACKDVEIHNF
jgi:hypothetical protein